MPLDGNESLYVTTDPEVRPDLSKPTPEALIWVLENWKESPVGDMKFQFSSPYPHRRLFGLLCNSAGCAMGTARLLWGDNSYKALYGAPQLSARSHEIYIEGVMNPFITAKVVAGRMRDALADKPIRYRKPGDREPFRLRSAARG